MSTETAQKWRCRVCRELVAGDRPACALGHLRPDPTEGINDFGVQMCSHGRYHVGRPHAWEPGEHCPPERVVPILADQKGPDHA